MPRRKKRNAKNPKGALAAAKRGYRKLTLDDKMLVIQTYYALGSVYGTSKKLGIAGTTVSNVLKEAESDPSLMAARKRTYDELNGKITNTVTEIIDSIRPEHLEFQTHEIHNDSGQLVRVLETGPSLRDKAFAASVLTDKIKILQDARHSVIDPARDQGTDALMLPGDVAGSRRRIAQLIKSVEFMKVEIDDGGVTTSRVEVLRKQAMVSREEVADAEFELVGPDPFD